MHFNFHRHPGEGDQFLFDVKTVLGRQMEKALFWLDQAEVETTVVCCSEKGLKVKKKCGGGKPNAPSCKSVCGIGGKPGGGGEGIFYSISIYSIFYSAKHRYIFIQAQLRAVVGFPR